MKNAEPDEWVFERVRGDLARALDRIAVTGVAMEINTSGLNKVYSEMNPGPEMLELMCERGIKVVVGSDAHEPGRVGDDFGQALDHLEDAGYHEIHIFENRKPNALSIAEARESLMALA